MKKERTQRSEKPRAARTKKPCGCGRRVRDHADIRAIAEASAAIHEQTDDETETKAAR
jgi:hypothetical protein